MTLVMENSKYRYYAIVCTQRYSSTPYIQHVGTYGGYVGDTTCRYMAISTIVQSFMLQKLLAFLHRNLVGLINLLRASGIYSLSKITKDHIHISYFTHETIIYTAHSTIYMVL
jgi:hypothetical protein